MVVHYEILESCQSTSKVHAEVLQNLIVQRLAGELSWISGGHAYTGRLLDKRELRGHLDCSPQSCPALGSGAGIWHRTGVQLVSPQVYRILEGICPVLNWLDHNRHPPKTIDDNYMIYCLTNHLQDQKCTDIAPCC